MITELATAIKTFYDSSDGATLRAANTGGLFWQQAPQAVATSSNKPYTVYSFVSSSIDESMGGQNDRIERVDVQFSIFSRKDDGGVEIADISDKLMAWLDWNRFSITGSFTIIASERNGIGSIPVIDEIWQTSLFYTIWVDW